MSDSEKGVEPMDVDSCSDNEIAVRGEVGENHKKTNHDFELFLGNNPCRYMSRNNDSQIQGRRKRLNISVYKPADGSSLQVETTPILNETNQTSSSTFPNGRFSSGTRGPISKLSTLRSTEDQDDITSPILYSAVLTNSVENGKNDGGVPGIWRKDGMSQSMENESTVVKTTPESKGPLINLGASGIFRNSKKSVTDEETEVQVLPNIQTPSIKPNDPMQGTPQESEMVDEGAFYDLEGGLDETSQECDSFSDIEGLICGLNEFEQHRWSSSTSPHRLYFGSAGSWYEGDVDGKKMSGLGTLYSKDKRQFIRGMWFDNILKDLHSFQFTDQGSDEWTIYIRKQANSYLLTFDEDEFVARAQLFLDDAADFSLPFRRIKLHFFDNLSITKVIEDRLQSDRQSSMFIFEKALRAVVKGADSPTHFAASLILLEKYSRDNSPKSILTNIINNEDIPVELRSAANDLLVTDCQLSQRRLELFKFSHDIRPPELNIRSVIKTVYTEAIRYHRKALVDRCPSSLPSLITSIEGLPPEKIIYVSKQDVELFHHLTSMTEERHFMPFFNYLHSTLFEKLNSIGISSPPSEVMPLSSPVYGFLFKSFLEIISEISLKAENCSVMTMFTNNCGKWTLIDEIHWKKDVKPSKQTSLTQQSLECQYGFIFKLLRHFEPKYYSCNQTFEYDLKVFNHEDSDDSWIYKQFKKIKKRLIRNKDAIDIPEDRRIWLYILDHTIYKVLKQDSPNSASCLELFKPLLDRYITFISTCPTSSYESFRIVTHNILMFIVQASPHFQVTDNLSDKDIIILDKQMKYITSISADMKSDVSASSDFRNLIDEYNRYWSLWHLVASDVSTYPLYLVSRIEEIREMMLTLVDVSLDKVVHVSTLITYFRELNDFIEDLKDIDFSTNWFVKKDSSLADVTEKVDNKIASEARCSYRVIDIDGFVRCFDDSCLPPHYIIHVVRKLMECAVTSLNTNWTSSSELSVAQLEGTGALLGAVRRSFLYLKEQPDYRDFELFSTESVQPFLQAVNECHALEEFKNRINIVKESFWYIRKMDEIGIVEALELINKLNNSSFNLEKLKKGYERYLLKYNEYIGEVQSKSTDDGIDYVVKCLRNDEENQRKFNEWDNNFKTVKLPIILAGVSAVWSLLVSKDVRGSGKFLKPHCIQVLCVMRLLTLDKSSLGMEHHLAQVLTGQGKSVILGLLSAVLAFVGYKVRLVCYSEYLAKRDKGDFDEFFRTLGFTYCINYGTFGDMVAEFVYPVIEGKRVSLSGMVESLVLQHRPLKKLGSPTSSSNETVLLIDEVDVFFSEHFYGNTCNPMTIVKIPGLPLIQEKLWEIALENDILPETLFSRIQRFIDEGVKSGNRELEEYNEFVQKPGRFTLLHDEGIDLKTKEFTNRSLMENHLMEMAEAAILVSKGTIHDSYIHEFKLIDGKICMLRSEDGIYSCLRSRGYYGSFNYFRLKKVEFDHTSFRNYGYILLDTGSISYAELPKEFPLILGVSGTVSNLTDHENEALRSYNINSYSILPSFFGDSNLKFNKVSDFTVLNSTHLWSTNIFERIAAVLQKHRSVLTFFENYVELEAFKMEHGTKFDRLNLLTENTNEFLKSKYIDEAGIANTVTLCTRGMGRGVDFKSSMSVEKQGGVHVIQTFFSLDVKEETQIKGRTARKDNKGSYELILCKEHLIAANLLPRDHSGTCDYSSLHQSRLTLMENTSKLVAEKIERSENAHRLTMDFFGISGSSKK